VAALLEAIEVSMREDAMRTIGGTHAFLTGEQMEELDRRVHEFSGHLFTPRLLDGKRVGIVLDEASYRRVRERGHGTRGTVTDLSTGIQYEIAGASCTLTGCACDALATRKLPATPATSVLSAVSFRRLRLQPLSR